MTTPTVREMSHVLEAVTHDPFIDGLGASKPPNARTDAAASRVLEARSRPTGAVAAAASPVVKTAQRAA
jgi:hypothetical protein